jgi:hypothetical protein
MNVRRFMLRLAVGLLCFAVGWASAVLLGVAAPRRAEVRRVTHVEIIPHVAVPHVAIPHVDVPPPPMPFKSGCRAPKLRHAHEWHDVPRLDEFETMPMLPQLDERTAPLPPPPPPARPRRGVN